MTEPIITCENLVKIYQIADLEVLALQGLDLIVQKSELMGIVGASGSGKSTLMNVLGGLVRPSAGRVIVNGQNLLKMSDSALDRYRRTQVGFVWQLGARNLITYLNAQENVELPMTLAGVGGKETRREAEKLLDMVGLAERRHYYLPQLSGGEQLRVGIAVALANQPNILLADEPTGELDTDTAQTIYDAFKTLNQEMGLTILIVSHDPTIAQHVGRVMAIRDGKAASETIRSRRNGEGKTVDVIEAASEEDHFQELVVLDSAGRLQVPKAYREALNIRNRVHMEMTEDGVLIRPLTDEERNQFPNPTVTSPVVDDDELAPRGGWLNRLRKKR